MLICPKCKTTHQDGHTACSICKCELVFVSESDGENMVENKDSRLGGIAGKLLFFGAVFAIGIIILVNNINLADIEMSNIMKAHGGVMDTNQYMIYLEQSIIKYRVLGTILSILGGLGVLLSTSIKS